MTGSRFKATVAVLIAVVTTLATVIAFLQSEAGSLDDRANRDSKLYSLEAIGFKVASDARTNFEFNKVYQSWDELDTLAATIREDDPERAALYEKVRDEIASFSPLFDAKKGYFDAKTEQPDVARFEAETYVKQLAVLDQKFKAASAVKDAWDSKANAYVFLITLLSVSLFLYGLSLTVSSRFAQGLFTAVASVLALVVAIWAARTWAEPVPDLRDHPNAIEAFAIGESLAHRDKLDEAIAEYAKALTEEPEFYDARVSRGEALYRLDKNAEAAKDLEVALATKGEPHVASLLASAYYDDGRFADAVKVCRAGLEGSPDNLDLRFTLGLSLLAKGEIEPAQVEYRAGMERAAALVAEARAKNLEAPAELWQAIDEASSDLDGLAAVAAGSDPPPPRDKIVGAEKLPPVCEAIGAELDSMSTALEYTGKPPEGKLSATFENLQFGEPVFKNGKIEEVKVNPDASFPAGTNQVALRFDYAGMTDGRELIIKTFKGATEQPSWRVVEKWTLGTEGEFIYILAPSYTDTFVFPDETYTVEVFVDGHLAVRGSFSVGGE